MQLGIYDGLPSEAESADAADPGASEAFDVEGRAADKVWMDVIGD